MKALYSTATPVAWSRVVREHRVALVPLGIAIAINLVVLLVVVLPLSRRVASNEQRAETARQAEAVATAEFRQAEDMREGKSRATKDLETFYEQVLPGDVAKARRSIQSRVVRLAEAHDVDYDRGASDTEEIRDSQLHRFTQSMTLLGNWSDIRGFIYELETSPEFVIIDNIVLQEGEDAKAPVSLGLELSTYFRAAGAVSTAAPRGDEQPRSEQAPRLEARDRAGQADVNGR